MYAIRSYYGLHGRGFAEGSGSEGWYSGAKLADAGDVVVVTINHRLNVFGYLHLAEIAGDAFTGSGKEEAIRKAVVSWSP